MTNHDQTESDQNEWYRQMYRQLHKPPQDPSGKSKNRSDIKHYVIFDFIASGIEGEEKLLRVSFDYMFYQVPRCF